MYLISGRYWRCFATKATVICYSGWRLQWRIGLSARAAVAILQDESCMHIVAVHVNKDFNDNRSSVFLELQRSISKQVGGPLLHVVLLVSFPHFLASCCKLNNLLWCRNSLLWDYAGIACLGTADIQFHFLKKIFWIIFLFPHFEQFEYFFLFVIWWYCHVF